MSKAAESVPSFDLGLLNDGRLIEARDRLARMSISQICDAMPPLEVHEGVAYQRFPSSRDGYDDNEALVVLAGYGIGVSPASYIRLKVQQEAMADDDGHYPQVLYFPNNRLGQQRAYELNKQERGQVARGDMTPFGLRLVKVLQREGVESFSVAAHSQGTATGAALGKVASGCFEVKDSCFFDPATMHDWLDGAKGFGWLAEASITLAVADKCVSRIAKAARQSGIPALDVAHHTGDNLKDRIMRYLDTLEDGISALWFPENRALRSYLTKGGFALDLAETMEQNPDMHATIVAGSESRILPSDSFMKGVNALRARFGDRIHPLVVEEFGHEFPFHALLQAMIARLALGRLPRLGNIALPGSVALES